MAIEKITTYDYEVVGEGTLDHCVQVRRCDAYVDSDEPNVVLSSTFHRCTFDPDSDWSSESDKVKAICNAALPLLVAIAIGRPNEPANSDSN